MTARERVFASSQGSGDRKAVLCWPEPCDESDFVVSAGVDVSGRVRLAPVLNPFGAALLADVPVQAELQSDPARGEQLLDGLVRQSKRQIADALQKGADGILFLLYGARARHSTPMQYGGHFLERDREVLAGAGTARFNMIFVVGEDDAYLDFVSDLPAQAFGWDCRATGFSVAQMRALRAGALATNSLDADIEIRFGGEDVIEHLEREMQKTHV